MIRLHRFHECLQVVDAAIAASITVIGQEPADRHIMLPIRLGHFHAGRRQRDAFIRLVVAVGISLIEAIFRHQRRLSGQFDIIAQDILRGILYEIERVKALLIMRQYDGLLVAEIVFALRERMTDDTISFA